MLEHLGNRSIVVGRELTKLYEEVIRGNLSDIIMHFSKSKIKGEIVIVLSNVRNSKNLSKYLNEEEIRVVEIISEYLPNKDAAKLAAKIFKRNKKIFYDFLSN